MEALLPIKTPVACRRIAVARYSISHHIASEEHPIEAQREGIAKAKAKKTAYHAIS